VQPHLGTCYYSVDGYLIGASDGAASSPGSNPCADPGRDFAVPVKGQVETAIRVVAQQGHIGVSCVGAGAGNHDLPVGPVPLGAVSHNADHGRIQDKVWAENLRGISH